MFKLHKNKTQILNQYFKYLKNNRKLFNTNSTKLNVNPFKFDVIVVGIGSIGSAAMHYLSLKRLKVLGLEKSDIPNEKSSHIGRTRSFYFYDKKELVPYLRRSMTLWTRLQDEFEKQIYVDTGCFYWGRNYDAYFDTVEYYEMEYEEFRGGEVNEGYIGINLNKREDVLYVQDAGLININTAISLQTEAAKNKGGKFRENECVVNWEITDANEVKVYTDKEIYTAKNIVFTPGPWISNFFPQLKNICVVRRGAIGMYKSNLPLIYDAEVMPLFHFDHETEDVSIYVTPDFKRHGLQIYKKFHRNEICDDLDKFKFKSSVSDESIFESIDIDFLEEVKRQPNVIKAIMEVHTPDDNFILDWHPKYPQVIICSCCCGKGFQFAPVIGELISHMVSDKEFAKPLISNFKLYRKSLIDKLPSEF